MANFSSFLFILSIVLGACAAQSTDLAILNYALTLEHLESAFYNLGVSMFTQTDFTNAGYPSYAYAEIQRIASHELTHVNTLVAVITAAYGNGSAVPACVYNFPASMTVNTFVAIARSLERTGVSAYLGQVASITTKGYLTAAATITTIEARHASFLNVLSQYSGMPAPFDIPLNSRAVITIASAVITSCPYNLGVTPYSSLTLTSVNTSQVMVSVAGSAVSNSAGYFCNYLSSSQTPTSVVNSMCMVPSDVSGDVYVFITSNTAAVTSVAGGDSGVIAGPAVLTIDQGFKLSAALTSAPTSAPTSASTSAPTSASTSAPTPAPTSASSSGQAAQGGSVININFSGLLYGR